MAKLAQPESMMSNKFVLIVFGDAGLGGTSRSALICAKAWRAKNIEVKILCPQDINTERMALINNEAEALTNVDEIEWEDVRLIHFHFSNNSSSQNELIKKIKENISNKNSSYPPIILNNIFSSPDLVWMDWPTSIATTVLGEWARVQYCASHFGGSKRPFVVPNPQDEKFFRKPSAIERRNAKTKFHLERGRTLLRLGSPIMSKWSDSYIKIIEQLNDVSGLNVVLAGVPDNLKTKISKYKYVRILDQIANDRDLRDLYWAADIFVLDATRGESFGNVIMESLLSGTPVLYRAREYRDNTPWEFSDIPGFKYCEGANEFLECIKENVLYDQFMVEDENKIIDRYGLLAVGNKLFNILTQLEENNAPGWISDWGPARLKLPFLKRMKILTLHNPVATWLKQVKLRVSR